METGEGRPLTWRQGSSSAMESEAINFFREFRLKIGDVKQESANAKSRAQVADSRLQNAECRIFRPASIPCQHFVDIIICLFMSKLGPASVPS